MELEYYEQKFLQKLQSRLPSLWDEPLDVLPKECSIYLCSDLHVDAPANLKWLQALPVCTDPNSVLIVAGDVQHNLDKLEDALLALAYKYGRVFFVPGNHDLWALGNSTDSVLKFFDLLDMLDRIGIDYLPAPVTRSGVLIFPMFSWHSANFTSSSYGPSMYEKEFDMACKWPQCISQSTNPRQSSLLDGIPNFFRSLNDMTYATLSRCPSFAEIPNPRIISFSHFLPRSELYGGRHDLERVMGDLLLDTQLRDFGAFIHTFGHSHINLDRHIDGVRYIQHALGNHRQPQLSWRPKLIFDDSLIEDVPPLANSCRTPEPTVAKLCPHSPCKNSTAAASAMGERAL